MVMVNADHLAGGNWWKGQYRDAPPPHDPRYRQWVNEGRIYPARDRRPDLDVLFGERVEVSQGSTRTTHASSPVWL